MIVMKGKFSKNKIIALSSSKQAGRQDNFKNNQL
jgi:hypothetical protein